MAKWGSRIIMVLWLLLFFLMIKAKETAIGVETGDNPFSGYTDELVMEWVDSRGNNPIEIKEDSGYIYWGSKGKRAASADNVRYRTVGWDITVFARVNGVEYLEKYALSVDKSKLIREYGGSIISKGYSYRFYALAYGDVMELMRVRDLRSYEKIVKADKIFFEMDAIMTTIDANSDSLNGGLDKEDTEDEDASYWGKIYHLRDETARTKLSKIFSSANGFKTYMNHDKYLNDYILTIRFNCGAGEVSLPADYSVDSKNFIRKNEAYYEVKVRRFEKVNLPSFDSMSRGGFLRCKDRKNEGYLWRLNSTDGPCFTTAKTYKTWELTKEIYRSDCTINMYCKWKKDEERQINYWDGERLLKEYTCAAADEVTIATSLLAGIEERTGKSFAGWSKDPADKNIKYQGGETIKDIDKNITFNEAKEYNLYAVFRRAACRIRVEANTPFKAKDTVSELQSEFYEVYGDGITDDASVFDNYTSDKSDYNKLSSLKVPSLTGYNFEGYYTAKEGGRQLTDFEGKLLLEEWSDFCIFKEDSTIYAKWKPKAFSISCYKDENEKLLDEPYVWERHNVNYNDSIGYYNKIPDNGYWTFDGYIRADTGEKWANNRRESLLLNYELLEDIDLIGVWKDMDNPTIEISKGFSDDWNNKAVTIEATASDFSSGIKSLIISYKEVSSGEWKVYEKKGAYGLNKLTEELLLEEEGVYLVNIITYDNADIANGMSYPAGQVHSSGGISYQVKIDRTVPASDAITDNSSDYWKVTVNLSDNQRF